MSPTRHQTAPRRFGSGSQRLLRQAPGHAGHALKPCESKFPFQIFPAGSCRDSLLDRPRRKRRASSRETLLSSLRISTTSTPQRAVNCVRLDDRWQRRRFARAHGRGGLRDGADDKRIEVLAELRGGFAYSRHSLERRRCANLFIEPGFGWRKPPSHVTVLDAKRRKGSQTESLY